MLISPKIAAHFHTQKLTLLAKLFFDQAEEEKTHAMKVVHYVLDTQGEQYGMSRLIKKSPDSFVVQTAIIGGIGGVWSFGSAVLNIYAS